jgi:hypothetical protein
LVRAAVSINPLGMWTSPLFEGRWRKKNTNNH